MTSYQFKKVSRADVYVAVDSERDYQDAAMGNAARPANAPPLTPGEHVLCMEKLLHDARAEWYKPNNTENVMEMIRKATGVGVAAMELYGAPMRKMV